MPQKMPKRLVALSASAVATIYMAGVFSTRTAAESVAASATADAAVVPTSSASLTSTSSPAVSAVVGASATASPTAAATATPVATATTATTATATTPRYADGTYSGTGTSRFGTVSVSVTTSGGQIANVQITKVTTSFPVSRIASLPAQVIQQQTANVNTVTGATYSSQAFKQAVQQALSQALTA